MSEIDLHIRHVAEARQAARETSGDLHEARQRDRAAQERFQEASRELDRVVMDEIDKLNPRDEG